MKYLIIIVLCLSVLPLCGCGLIYAFTATKYQTSSEVEDTEANHLKMMHVVRSIVVQYDLKESKRGSPPREFTDMADYYYYSYARYPSSRISLVAHAYKGKARVSLSQDTLGNPTTKYAEIQGRLVAELKECFGEDVSVEMTAGKIAVLYSR